MMEYAGGANLDAMTQAVNYNGFLVSLVLSQARPLESIVDLGAGIGTFAGKLALQGFQVRCVEPDAAQANVIAALGLPVVGSLGDVADDSVDFLYALNVLEHVTDDGALLSECHAKLRAGGRLLVYVPAFPFLYSSMDRLVGHCRRYTRRELEERVTSAGLHLLVCRYADCAGVLASLVFKAVGNPDGLVNVGGLRAYDKYVFPLSRAGDRVFSRFAGKNLYALALRTS